jgi:hypothetical protein
MTTKNPTDGNLLFLNQEGGSCVIKHEQESPKIFIYLFFTGTLRRDFSLLDCAAGTQSRANQFDLLRDCEGDHF